MIPENDFKALSGMFADVEPKVEQAPEPVEEEQPFTIGFKNGAIITGRSLGKSSFMRDALESMAQSMQGVGRAFRGSGGIVMLHDDFDELAKMLTVDSLSMTRSKRTYEGHTIKRGTVEKEAFKTKTRGRLIGRKSW